MLALVLLLKSALVILFSDVGVSLTPKTISIDPHQNVPFIPVIHCHSLKMPLNHLFIHKCLFHSLWLILSTQNAALRSLLTYISLKWWTIVGVELTPTPEKVGLMSILGVGLTSTSENCRTNANLRSRTNGYI